MNHEQVAATMERLLMDSKPILVVFNPMMSLEERANAVRAIQELYQRMGGGGINTSPLDQPQVQLKPWDDPNRNLIY